QRETEALGELLRDLKQQLDVTLVVIEHDIPLIMPLADRIVAMDAGRVIAEGTPEIVRTDARVVEASLGGSLAAIELSGVPGATAVAFKLRGESADRLTDCGQSAGVAVLGVANDVAWGQLYTLLRTAGGASGEAVETASEVPAGDLFALANAVALMVGGATTIEDRQSNVLAYSSSDLPIDTPRRDTILGRKVPDQWLTRLREDGIFRRLWTMEEVVHVDYPDEDYR